MKKAKEALSQRSFDIIYLDHDLGGKVYVPSFLPNTGYALAKWISENNIKCKEIIIHSFNPTGAAAMKKVLPQAKLIPFNLKRNNERSPTKIFYGSH